DAGPVRRRQFRRCGSRSHSGLARRDLLTDRDLSADACGPSGEGSDSRRASRRERDFGRAPRDAGERSAREPGAQPATAAFEKLASSFDVLVAGDREEAIFQATADDSPKLVDADDPHVSLFLSPSRLDALPFPARHLVDADIDHYTIEGTRAMGLICHF